MCYDAAMATQLSLIEPGVVSVFRLFTGLMWLLLSLSVVPRLGQPDADGFAAALWLLMGGLFAYLAAPWPRRLLGGWFLPIALAAATAGPILADAASPGPGADPARLYFWLILPLLLISAQYGTRSLLLFTAVIVLLPPLAAALRGAGAGELQLHAAHAAGRLIIFLLAGYVVVQISGAQRRQRAELAGRNAELAQLAAAREQLATSQERNRLARELHDTLAHTLSAVNVQLKALEVLVDQDPAEARALLRRLQEQTRDGLAESRRALAALRARPVDELGLVGALRRGATEAAGRCGLELELRLPDQGPRLAPHLEQQIYQVAVEAIANVARHAGARRLVVELATAGRELRLRVADDGAGFTPDAAGPAGHYGIRGMRERAALLGGELQIGSAPGAGTTVTLRVPLEEATR